MKTSTIKNSQIKNTHSIKSNNLRAIFAALAFLVCFLVNARAGFLYVVNDNTAGNQIYGYNVNETTGALVALAGFPIATGGNGAGFTSSELITIDRANRRLYVLNDGSDTVSAYSINQTTGALAALPFSPINIGGESWQTIAVHPSGSPLIVGNDTSQVRSYTITATTATAAGSPFSTGMALPFSSVFSRDDSYFYTCGIGNNVFAGFSVNPTNGVLTALAGLFFNSGASIPVGYATGSQGRFFAADFNSNQVRAFTTASGIPTAVTGNPFVSGLTSAVDGVLSPNENFYYVADRDGNRVGAYQIAGSGASTTLTAVSGSPFASGGTFTHALVFNTSGSFLFAANGNSRNITTYSANRTTGVLTFNNVQAANTLGTAGRLTGIDYLPTTPATAASVSVGGRVMTASGRGIRNIIVTMTDANGNIKMARTSSFGYYHFNDVAAGETYILTATGKRFAFSQPLQVLNINEDTDNVNFVATTY